MFAGTGELVCREYESSSSASDDPPILFVVAVESEDEAGGSTEPPCVILPWKVVVLGAGAEYAKGSYTVVAVERKPPPDTDGEIEEVACEYGRIVTPSVVAALLSLKWLWRLSCIRLLGATLPRCFTEAYEDSEPRRWSFDAEEARGKSV